VPSLRDARKKKLTDDDRQIAKRLRAEREAGRFSQYELADELGVTRSTLSNFEQFQAPLSFAVGLEFCRRLNLSPRWLATGEEPKRPFASIDELEIAPDELRKRMRRGVDFLSGYDDLLRRPLDAWVRQNPPDKLVARMMRGGVEPLARQWSNSELVAQLASQLKILRTADSVLRKPHADVAETILAEIGARLAVRVGRRGGREAKS
jgi:transcriptional regulator with XRE-family HTH domain